jgi:RNA polymerase sigma-70 factor, ECF subfamily
MRAMASKELDTTELLKQAQAGDGKSLGELFLRHEERLWRMVHLRLDRRLQGRIDASDVLQETYLELSRSLADYLRDPAIPFYLWLRMIASRKLHALHRHHLGTRIRDASREVSLGPGVLLQASSVSLAAQLVGRLTGPSEAVIRAELQLRVQEALNSMNVLDREVLALRHFEQLTNAEAAQVLGISEQAASNRFVRALKRLKGILGGTGGVLDNR